MPIYPEHGRWHVYFYDIDTRAELAAWAWMGTAGGAMRNGMVLDDTVYDITVGDRGFAFTITADDFPGRRVGVKIWHPERPAQWYFLMRRDEPGFAPDGSAPAGAPHGLLGSDARRLPRAAAVTAAPHYLGRIPPSANPRGRKGQRPAEPPEAARAAFVDRVVDLVREFGIKQADLTGASGKILIVLGSGRAADKASGKLDMYAIPHELTQRKALLSVPFPAHLAPT